MVHRQYCDCASILNLHLLWIIQCGAGSTIHDTYYKVTANPLLAPPLADDLTRFLEEAKWTSPTTSKPTAPTTSVPPPPGALRPIPFQDRKTSEPAYNVDLIEVDDASRDIFGDDGLAELNDALMQLSTIHAGRSPGVYGQI